jgi:hypothetical protein
MEPKKTDQELFDEQVDRNGRVFVQTVAGAGILAALVLSTIAIIRTTQQSPAAMMSPARIGAVQPAPAQMPRSASVVIEHVTRGCHAMLVNGATQATPTATIRLGTGGMLHVTDNDVMPHRLVQLAGPAVGFTGAAMSHMGAQSTVMFPHAGTYSLTTKAGEDYSPGIQTIGPDNTLRLKVVVAS